MEEDFIYWRHPSVPGIKVEEISGGERYRGNVWFEMARQLYCENGKDAYRELGHYANGAPFLYGENSRISITHCPGFFAVATLPPTPEVDLNGYSDRAALGIDAERRDREQVLKIRARFLSEEEMKTAGDSVESNILAWTVKEAAYKAALASGLDFTQDVKIDRMPKLAPATPVFDAREFGLAEGDKELPEDFYGEARVVLPEEERKFRIYSYLSDDVIVTLAFNQKSAKFGRLK